MALSHAGLLGATYYIKPDGNNSGAGTESEPWNSLAYAFSSGKLGPGDTAILLPGLHNGPTATTGSAGTAELPILIQGMPNAIVTHRININHDYITLQNMTVKYGGVVVSGCRGVKVLDCDLSRSINILKFANDTAYCTASGNTITHGAANSMFDVGGRHHLIENNYFTANNGFDVHRLNNAINCVFRGNRYENITSSSRYETTITQRISDTAKTITVPYDGADFPLGEYVELTATDNASLVLRGWIVSRTPNSLQVELTYSSGTGTKESWILTNHAGNNHADIYQAFTFDSYGHQFQGNLYIANTCQLGNIEGNGNPNIRDWTFKNNVFWKSRIQINISAPGFSFFHNTVYDHSGNAGFRGSTKNGSSGIPIRVVNNIFCRVGTIESGGPYSGAATQADYNLITDFDDSDKREYREPNGINGGYRPEEIFIAPDKGDFRLAPNSPAIGAGRDLSQIGIDVDFQGIPRARWDLGAYAATTSASPPAGPSNLKLGR